MRAEDYAGAAVAQVIDRGDCLSDADVVRYAAATSLERNIEIYADQRTFARPVDLSYGLFRHAFPCIPVWLMTAVDEAINDFVPASPGFRQGGDLFDLALHFDHQLRYPRLRQFTGAGGG